MAALSRELVHEVIVFGVPLVHWFSANEEKSNDNVFTNRFSYTYRGVRLARYGDLQFA